MLDEFGMAHPAEPTGEPLRTEFPSCSVEPMYTWGAFRGARPDLADAGQALLYQFGGVGLAFLGTVRPDGGPRLHPMCPILHEDGLYALLIPSPKARDLRRDPRYALHAFPPEDNEDAIYLTGEVIVREGDTTAAVGRRPVPRRTVDGCPTAGFDDQTLVEFSSSRAHPHRPTATTTRSTRSGTPRDDHPTWPTERSGRRAD